ncbi:RNA polymerase sigma factor SigJ [compost metagenome]
MTAAVHPIRTRDHVSRFLLGSMRQAARYEGGIRIELEALNGQIGLVIRLSDRIDTIVLMQIIDGAARRIFFIRNPDKLTYF